MTKTERNHYLGKLLALRSRLKGELLHLTDEAFGGNARESTQPNNLAELGGDAFEQELTLQMLESEGNALGEINDALGRIKSGMFGKCENCGKPIPKARLDAIPYTKYCVGCARVAEAGS